MRKVLLHFCITIFLFLIRSLKTLQNCNIYVNKNWLLTVLFSKITANSNEIQRIMSFAMFLTNLAASDLLPLNRKTNTWNACRYYKRSCLKRRQTKFNGFTQIKKLSCTYKSVSVYLKIEYFL